MNREKEFNSNFDMNYTLITFAQNIKTNNNYGKRTF